MVYSRIYPDTWPAGTEENHKHVSIIVQQNATIYNITSRRSQWRRGLRRRSTAARLLGLLVRIPPGAWMSVCCECCVLSGRGLCDELITRPEESYRLRCVVVCDLENLMNEEPNPINVIELNLLAPELFFKILTHSVHKM